MHIFLIQQLKNFLASASMTIPQKKKKFLRTQSNRRTMSEKAIKFYDV
jgi:hypothetical protein